MDDHLKQLQKQTRAVERADEKAATERNKLNEIIRAAIQHHTITVMDIHRTTGLSRQTIYRIWKDGQTND